MDLKYDLQMFAENENSENANKGDDNQSKTKNSNETSKTSMKEEKRFSKDEVERLIKEYEEKKKAEEEKLKKEKEEEEKIFKEKEKEEIKKYFEEKRKELEQQKEQELFQERLNHKIEVIILKKGLTEEQAEKVMKYLRKDDIKDLDEVEKKIDEVIQDFNIYSEKDQENKQKASTTTYRTKNSEGEKESIGERLAKKKQKTKETESIIKKYFRGGI